MSSSWRAWELPPSFHWRHEEGFPIVGSSFSELGTHTRPSILITAQTPSLFPWQQAGHDWVAIGPTQSSRREVPAASIPRWLLLPFLPLLPLQDQD